MTENMFGAPETPPPGSTGSGGATGNEQSPKEIAKEQVSDVAQEGVQGGRHLASVATDQAREVASEAGSQARALLDQAKSELAEHAGSQQHRVADQLHALSKELGSMASKSEQAGLATDLAKQASRQLGSAAHWVSEREPGSLVTEMQDFARRKPGTFLVLAAGIGLVAGRMTRGAKAGVPEAPQGAAGYSGPQGVPTTSQPTTSPAMASPTTTIDEGLPGLSPSNPGAGAVYTEGPSTQERQEPLPPRAPGLTS